MHMYRIQVIDIDLFSSRSFGPVDVIKTSLKPSFVFAFLVHVTRYVSEMAISVVFYRQFFRQERVVC